MNGLVSTNTLVLRPGIAVSALTAHPPGHSVEVGMLVACCPGIGIGVGVKDEAIAVSVAAACAVAVLAGGGGVGVSVSVAVGLLVGAGVQGESGVNEMLSVPE